MKRIAVGKIKSAHGIKGEVKIISLTDFPSRFIPGLTLFISPPLPQIDKLVVEQANLQAKEIILKFEGIDSREQAESLAGCALEVSLGELVDLPAGAYWQFQVIGLKVFTANDDYLGQVSEILQTGANDVYVIKSSPSDKGILIPAVKEVVKLVDTEKGVMVVEPVPGLIE